MNTNIKLQTVFFFICLLQPQTKQETVLRCTDLLSRIRTIILLDLGFQRRLIRMLNKDDVFEVSSYICIQCRPNIYSNGEWYIKL